MKPGTVAVADIDESAWPFLQHIREVLRSQQWRDIAVDLVGTGNLLRDRSREVSAAFVIHQDRITRRVGKVRLGAVELRRPLHDFAHPLLE